MLRGRPLVQIPVPPVRPIFRRTIKRFLRLLPSVLLLLFVASLIFVTLMQIAVIHAHRRSLAFQRSPNAVLNSNSSISSTNTQMDANAYATQTSSARLRGISVASAAAGLVTQKKRQEVLRIEALLDRSSLSLEANTKVLQNYVNSGRIKQILNLATKRTLHSLLRNESLSRSLQRPLQFSKSLNSPKDAFNEPTSRGFEMETFNESSLANNEHTTALNYEQDYAVNDSDRHSTSLKLHRGIYLCPEVPQGLIGRLRVEFHPNSSRLINSSQTVSWQQKVLFGGHYEPLDCYSRHRVAIIIPYRDRKEHLFVLLNQLHPILQRQQLDYKIFVVEQFGNDTFNKGVLMNAGVKEALKEYDFHCFVFHDVDLIPEDDRNLYTCPAVPRHMSVAVDKFNYSLPYSYLVGGVFAISKKHFILVNGYSNLYWGWGGEDDDMAHRLKYHNLHISRPPESIARYSMIKHKHRPESPNNVRSALLRMAKRRATRDGLSSVRYKMIYRQAEHLYTHLIVEIGSIHKWSFPSRNKLVLHF